jgi:hypothetical protein
MEKSKKRSTWSSKAYNKLFDDFDRKYKAMEKAKKRVAKYNDTHA